MQYDVFLNLTLLSLWTYFNKEAFCYAKMLYILAQKHEFDFNWKKSWHPLT